MSRPENTSAPAAAQQAVTTGLSFQMSRDTGNALLSVNEGQPVTEALRLSGDLLDGVPSAPDVWNAIEHDDVLAAGLARLLLYTDPARLPELGKESAAWDLYLRTWRPGAYDRGTPAQRAELRNKWAANYAAALEVVR